jgi:hypothetical protein
VKMPLFIASAILTLSTTSHAGSLGGGPHGGSFRSGFVARSAGNAFRIGRGIRRNVGLRRGYFQQFVWPAYWYPYPYDYSYLDYEPDDVYQYSDVSAAPLQPESSRPAVDHAPIVVIVNAGNSRPADSSPNTAYGNSGYNSTDAAWQQRIVTQYPNEKVAPPTDTSTGTFVPPVVPQPTQTTAKVTQKTPPAQGGAFGNFVLVSWLECDGKDVIYVQNTETNDIQKITSEPNLDNFRLVELHSNADPKLFEAVISNGSQQGPVRFHF